ncbi:MAG TPA: heparinase II/III family protein [bacterium]|nr:heparinase II/III family protein [bacterium]HQL63921.1 heparinase II/III family protein [bacterium]
MRNAPASYILIPMILAGIPMHTMGSPAHPCLFFLQNDLPAIRARAARTDRPEYHLIADRIILSASELLSRDIPIYSTPGDWPHRYTCDGIGDGNDDYTDGCGGFLLFQETRPESHICPRCGKLYQGSPYNEAWISLYNDQVATHLRNLGMAYLLTDEIRYAEKAAEMFRRYARLYPALPLHDIYGGQRHTAARLYAQTLDEAIWVLEMLWGLDAVYDSPAFSEEDRQVVESNLLCPILATLSRTDIGFGNYQAWVTSAIGALGYFVGDENAIRQALAGPLGYNETLEHGYGEDGFSLEGSVGYHYYGLTGLLYLGKIAATNGDTLWNERIRQVLFAPLYYMEPDGSFPTMNDAGPAHLGSYIRLFEVANTLSADPLIDRILTLYYNDLGYSRSHYSALFSGADFDPSTGVIDLGDVSSPSGIAVLRGDGEEMPLMVMMDHDVHGGRHGHYDKLNIILYGQGRELIPDLGTGSYVSNLLDGWLRRTVAHNTVVTGELGQDSGNEAISPLSFSRMEFSSVQVVSSKADAGVYPGEAQVERTIIKVEDDYLLIMDRIENAVPPVDIVWHSLGQFECPAEFPVHESDYLQRWSCSGSGYQYLVPPSLYSGRTAEDVLEIPLLSSLSQIVWRLPLSLSDNMEDLTLWDGECSLSERHTQGASSIRFLAVPDWTVSIGKDISHFDMDLSSLDMLGFDYFLDGGQGNEFWVVIQHLPQYNRAAWKINDLSSGVWHHAEIDLGRPDLILGGADRRTRVDFLVSAAGNPEDSFFVYLDNLVAESDGVPEAALMTGLAATVMADPFASLLLTDGPGVRSDERHGVLLVRGSDPDVAVFTMLEAYQRSPRWIFSTDSDEIISARSGDTEDVVQIEPDRRSYFHGRTIGGAPSRIVLFNGQSAELGPVAVSSPVPFDLELQVSYFLWGGYSISYRTGSLGDRFYLRLKDGGPHDILIQTIYSRHVA